MSRVLAPVLRNGFPNNIPCLPLWDGVTYYLGVPSASGSEGKLVVGEGTYLPVKTTLDGAAALFWRIRKFIIHGAIYGSDPDDSDNYPMVDFDNLPAGSPVPQEASRISNPQKEEELILVSDFFQNDVGRSQLMVLGYENMARDKDSPADFWIGVYALVQHLFTALLVPALSSLKIDAWTLSAATLTLHFRPGDTGINIPLYEDPSFGPMTGAMDIIPNQFWPYNGLYDEDTGERIA